MGWDCTPCWDLPFGPPITRNVQFGGNKAKIFKYLEASRRKLRGNDQEVVFLKKITINLD